MPGFIGQTLRYYKRNGFTATWYAVQERLWEKKHVKYGYTAPSEEELEKQRGKTYERKLKFSIVVPAYETPEVFLQDLFLSVADQTYSDYELIIADASESRQVKRVTESFREQYPGIVYLPLEKNEGISENTNRAIEKASGDYIALLDHDDMLTPDALWRMREEIDRSDGPVLLYSDEDKCDKYLERYFAPHRKRDFDPELLMTNNYICHLSVYRADVIRSLKLRSEFNGAQDHDLLLRTAAWCREHYEKDWKERIRHVPYILYHWRSHESSTSSDPAAKNYAFEAGKRSIKESLSEQGIEATLTDLPHLGFYRVEYEGGVFAQRPDIAMVGGPVIEKEKICGGAMKADGTVLFDGLPEGFSGPMHIAALQQSVEALDIENMTLREELRPLYEKITEYAWPFPGDDNAQRRKDRSLKLCKKLREEGYTLLYDPQFAAGKENV